MHSKHRTDEEWMSLIQECRCSGLSDRVWCEQNNISINTFYNTVTRLRKKSCDIPKSISVVADSLEIVPLSVIDEEEILPKKPVRKPMQPLTTEQPALVITISGCSVSINNNAGREVIYHTLFALHQL